MISSRSVGTCEGCKSTTHVSCKLSSLCAPLRSLGRQKNLQQGTRTSEGEEWDSRELLYVGIRRVNVDLRSTLSTLKQGGGSHMGSTGSFLLGQVFSNLFVCLFL